MTVEVPRLTENSILKGFLRAAGALREFHRAFRVAACAEIRPFAIERLHQLVPFATAELDGSLHGRTGWVIAHPRLPHPVAPDLLSNEALSPLASHMDLLRRASPWLLYRERLLNAAAWLDDGDYSASVLETAIAIEGLIDDALALLHWDAERSVLDAYKQSHDGIVKRVRVHLPRALGDLESIWSTDAPGGAADWKRHVADQRNLIVHRGYPSSPEEAHDALAAAQALSDQIAERMLANADRFPRAALVLLGEGAIKREGRFSARVSAVAGLDWLDTFHAWQEPLVVDDPSVG
jgi:hypothetical protein